MTDIIRICKDCRWFQDGSYRTACSNPKVAAGSGKPWLLVYGRADPYEERRRWFGPCGRKGNLWERRHD